MDIGKASTNKSTKIVEDLDAEYSSNKRSIFGDTEAEDTKRRVASDDEESAGFQDNEDISMKKQGYGTVYYRTTAKRGLWELQVPYYTAKRKRRGIYTKKVDDSSYEERQSKRKDAGDNVPDSNNSGDDGEDDSSEDEKEKVTNPDDAWTFFQYVYKLNPKCIEAMGNLGYHTVDDIEILGSATPVDISILTSTTITHVTAIRIDICSKFLYLQGNYQRNTTISLLERHNNKTKQPDTNDSGSDDDNIRKWLLWPGTFPVIPHFSNIVEEFEGFWDKLEIKLKQSCLWQHLEKAPTSNKGKDFQENYSLHWILSKSFQDTDDEHTVK